jgi:hypothetical protein
MIQLFGVVIALTQWSAPKGGSHIDAMIQTGV